MNGVLQDEMLLQPQNQLMRQQRIRRRGADIKKERAVRFQHATCGGGPLLAPIQITAALRAIGIFSVGDAEIIGRRGDDEIDRGLRETRHAGNAVSVAQIEIGHAAAYPEMRHVQTDCSPAGIACRAFL